MKVNLEYWKQKSCRQLEVHKRDKYYITFVHLFWHWTKIENTRSTEIRIKQQRNKKQKTKQKNKTKQNIKNKKQKKLKKKNKQQQQQHLSSYNFEIHVFYFIENLTWVSKIIIFSNTRTHIRTPLRYGQWLCCYYATLRFDFMDLSFVVVCLFVFCLLILCLFVEKLLRGTFCFF